MVTCSIIFRHGRSITTGLFDVVDDSMLRINTDAVT